MRRAVVIRLRIADCELRIGTAGVRGPWRIPLIDPSPSSPQSAIRNPQLSYLPVGKQHAPGGMRLRIALVRHAQVGPADAVAARHESAERFVVARLAADRYTADTEARCGRLCRRDGRVERGHVAAAEPEDAHLVPAP